MNDRGQLNSDERERLQLAEQLLMNTTDPMIFAVRKKLSEKHDIVEVYFGNAVSHEDATEFLDDLQGYIDSKFNIDHGSVN